MLHLIKKIRNIIDDFSVVCLFNTNEKRIVDFLIWVKEFKEANDGWASKISDIKHFKKK